MKTQSNVPKPTPVVLYYTVHLFLSLLLFPQNIGTLSPCSSLVPRDGACAQQVFNERMNHYLQPEIKIKTMTTQRI